MKKFYILAFFAATTLLACKTAVKAYDKGDYTDAVALAVKKLQKDPADGETKALLQAAYRNAVSVSESRIRSLSLAGDGAYEQLFSEYRRLQSVYELVRPYPALATLVGATDYTDYVNTYGTKAAEIHLRRGEGEAGRGTKDGYKAAYRAFNTALRFADTRDTRRQRDEAYAAAQTHIVVLPLNDGYGSYRYASSYRVREFERELLRNLRYHTGSEFVQLHTEAEARSKGLMPDQLLRVELGRFEFGRPYDREEVRTVSKSVVVKETVYKPDSVVKEYATVTARLITTQRTVVSGGEVYMTFLDPDGRVLWNDRLSGEHRWQTSFLSYRGDDRALGESDRTALNKKAERAPDEEEAVECVLREIESDMRHRLRMYLANL